jgi:hypothetical protein
MSATPRQTQGHRIGATTDRRPAPEPVDPVALFATLHAARVRSDRAEVHRCLKLFRTVGYSIVPIEPRERRARA